MHTHRRQLPIPREHPQYTQNKKMPLQRSPNDGAHSSQPNLSTYYDEDGLVARVNTRKRRNPDCENFNEFCHEMREMFKELKLSQEEKFNNLNKAIEDLTLQNTQLIKSNSEIEKGLQESKERQNILKEKVKQLEVECATAHTKIHTLEEQLHEIQKSQLRKIIEIRNVKRQENENLQDIVKNLLKAVDIDAHNIEIEQIYRGGKDNAPIIVKLQDLNQKIQILKAVRDYNTKNKVTKLNSENLGLITPLTPVYVSEKLTPTTKTLLFSAKKLVQDGLYKYCWISKGKVMLRKNDSQPALCVTRLSDIEVLTTCEKLD